MATRRHHHGELHGPNSSTDLNVLRAAVLGANDGIISLAGLVIGVAGASVDRSVVAPAAIAGILAGAASMAIGEFVSVSSQRDTEDSLVSKERQELIDNPDHELAELAAIYEHKGLSPDTARAVALELTAHDPLAAHLEAELRIDPDTFANPWRAAVASVTAFFLGALFPILGVLVAPKSARVLLAGALSVLALLITGLLSKRVSGAGGAKSVRRIVLGGVVAMTITYLIGKATGQLF